MDAGGAADATQYPQASVPSAEEEALKRNTDCVYFLASPLTCKKGAECEYRHSEYARVNPRDCWYWLNGNCLNLKCAFRHPPLDSLLGEQASATGGASLHPQHIVVPPPVHNYSNSGRQPVPCIFFQKGLCLKGDKCAFLHGTNPAGNKFQQITPTTLAGDVSSSKKPSGVLQKCSQEQKVPVDSSKPHGLQSSAKMVPNTKSTIPGNGLRVEKHAPVARSMDVEACKPSHPLPSVNGSSQIKYERMHQTHVSDERSFQNDKEAEEFMRESSPGFDVLVDDELGDSEYFQGEDQFGMTGAHDRRNLSSVNEYDLDHSAEYNSLSDVDREILHDRRAYESFNHVSGQFGRDQRRGPAEIMYRGPSRREGRNHVKSGSPDRFDGSDLRHRLSKQRRVDGLRSVVTNEFDRESHVEERNHQGSSQRDRRHASSHEGSLSSRLRGRIKFPGMPAAADGSVDRPDREIDRGRSWGGQHQGRLGDRLRGRLQEENNDAMRRSPPGPRLRRETWSGDDTHFAAPKSLAELKRSRESSSGAVRQQHSGRGDQPSDADLSFEGPKPLSVLVKRKRPGETEGASKGEPFVGVEENNEELNQGRPITSRKSPSNAQVHGSSPPPTKEDGLKQQPDKEEVIGLTTSSFKEDVNPSTEKEEDVLIEDAVDEHELYGDDQLEDGVYDYEQAEDGEYNYEDVENPDEEYLDDEDGDDYAKKVGAVLS